jgi:hypothetical protein
LVSLDGLSPNRYDIGMKRKRPPVAPKSKGRLSSSPIRRWARRLAEQQEAVMARHPGADPEDVRLTLISLQSPPLVRLNRSLRRGRGFAAFRK